MKTMRESEVREKLNEIMKLVAGAQVLATGTPGGYLVNAQLGAVYNLVKELSDNIGMLGIK